MQKWCYSINEIEFEVFTLKLSWVKANALKAIASLERREGELRARFKKYLSPSPRSQRAF